MADSRAVTASIGKDKYRTEVKTSVHTLYADEPEDVGGKDSGPTPGDFMRMSLASCTAITLRMYADRKKWDVEKIVVTVTNERDNYKTMFQCLISITGNIDESQGMRLLEIAHACPVHKVLSNPVTVNTEMTIL
jgi:putative redox protein